MSEDNLHKFKDISSVPFKEKQAKQKSFQKISKF